MTGDAIALFASEDTPKGIRVSQERHYHLAPKKEMTPGELQVCRERLHDD